MWVTTKLFPSIILLLVLPRELYGQTFDTVGCGTDKGCFASPASCSNSENCKFLITYKAKNSSKVEFELSGEGNWVAVGFSNDQKMADTDILMCVSNPTLTGHYYAASQRTPKKTNAPASAVATIEQTAEGGVVKCRISREINPNPAISNFTDLNQEVFLLAAIGGLSGSTLQQHKREDREASPTKVKVTQANSTVTGSEDPTQQGSFRFPDSCTSSADCDFLVTYQASGDDVLFELSGKGNWAGVGFSEDNQMPDTDMLICASDEALSGHYYAPDRNTPKRTTPTPSVLEITEQTFDNGVVKCKISREKNPGTENFRDLDKDWFLLGAIGPLSGNSIGQHNKRQASNSKIIVTKGGVSTADDDKPVILAHGIMMTLAWILFAFVGLFTARYMRQVWEPTELLGKKAWFTVHRTLMTITVLLTVAATILIFAKKREWSSGAGAHPYCGIIAIAFAVVQPIMAAFRPHPGAPRRNIFNWAHRIVGTIALIMAVVSIYLGLDVVGLGFEGSLGDQGFWAVITFYIGEFLIFLFESYLILSKRNKEKRSVSVTNTGDIQMQPPGHQTSPEPEMSIKEAMIRTMMFVFVVLLGASVALTIILSLVLKYYKQ